MDPADNRGEKQISYKEYMDLAKVSMDEMKNTQIFDEILNVTVDEEKNQATIETKSSITTEIMGMKMEDVSISTTTYGVVDNQIKILSTEDKLISSGLVKD